MTYDFILPFAWFCFVSSVTPGPNNLMLMASGANFGVRRTVPHMLGVAIGFSVMVVAIGVGLAGVFEVFPWAHTVLTVLSVAYLLWLAWKIATAAPPSEGEAVGHPFTFMQAAAFQWVNPKAWAMGLSAVTVYAPSQDFGAILLISTIFGLVNLPSIAVWTVMGQQLQRFLAVPGRLRVFNVAMGALLVGSLWFVLAG